MKRALIAALTLALLVPAGAAAQDDYGWPTGLELRRELQSIGHEFGFNGREWLGGRVERIDPAVTIMDTDRGPSVWVRIGESDWDLDWWDGRGSGLTAAMEVASILMPEYTKRATLWHHLGTTTEEDCWNLQLDGGVVEAAGGDRRWDVIFWPEGAVTSCPGAREMTPPQ
jgi:hypothetical protein